MDLNLFDRRNDNSNNNFIKEFIEELKNAKVGDVYEKIDGKYIYNSDITSKLKEIM